MQCFKKFTGVLHTNDGISKLKKDNDSFKKWSNQTAVMICKSPYGNTQAVLRNSLIKCSRSSMYQLLDEIFYVKNSWNTAHLTSNNNQSINVTI